VANYLGPWSKLLEDNGYPADEARAAALMALPDILRYDRTARAAYPNGRALTDDVYSMRFAWLTRGRVTSDGRVAVCGSWSLCSVGRRAG
jgi:hypothetical protein